VGSAIAPAISGRALSSACRNIQRHRDFQSNGYLLESQGTPVGVLLLIFSSIVVDGATRIRCSSWYVKPAFRSYAAMLRSQAVKHEHLTYFNITSVPHTLPMLEAQGFARYCDGRFVAVPALSRRSKRSIIEVVTPALCAGEDLQSFEIELLLAHARHGCISVICSSADSRHPFRVLAAAEGHGGTLRLSCLLP
jgi:hypothetical protein